MKSRKHLKRHEKPYGCTFAACPKRFGSKNDWKRHENSQHFQLEVWKCDEKPTDRHDGQCGKVCHRRETFKHHLQKDHKIVEAKRLDDKIERCRIGRNCETRFWCGFCQKIVEIKQEGISAWSERFNHIDDHFSGRNAPKKEIKEWKNVDPEHADAGLSHSPGDSGPASPDELRHLAQSPRHAPSLGDPANARQKKRKAQDEDEPRDAKRALKETRALWKCVRTPRCSAA
jgi:sal-like protein